MKIKSFITLSLLLAISFSIVHEYAFAFYDNDHCNTTEYVQELNGPITQHAGSHESGENTEDDICDIHFEYHQAFLLLPDTASLQDYTHYSYISIEKETYTSQINKKFIKPPIA